MSDATQGEGWWQAADGKWYPPEQHPDYQAGATQAMGATPPPTEAVPSFPPPTQAMPPFPAAPMPGGPPPGGPPPGAPVGPPPGAPGSGSNTKWIVGGAIAVVIILLAAFLLTRDDGKKENVAATSSSSSSSSTKSSSSSKSTSSSSSSKSTSSSSSSSTDVQARMLNAADIGPDFQDDTFTVDTGNTNCGQPNFRTTTPPKGEVGSQASNGVAQFREDAAAFNTEADAKKVLDLILSQTDTSACPNPTIEGGEPVSFSQPVDRSSEVTTPVQQIFEIDFQTPEVQGQFFVVQDTVAIVTFTFVTQTGTDTSKLPDAMDLVNKGLKKIVNG